MVWEPLGSSTTPDRTETRVIAAVHVGFRAFIRRRGPGCTFCREHETSGERTNNPDQILERIEEHETVGWISRQNPLVFRSIVTSLFIELINPLTGVSVSSP